MIDPISREDFNIATKAAIRKAREVFPREAQDALDKSNWGFDIMIREILAWGLQDIEDRK